MKKTNFILIIVLTFFTTFTFAQNVQYFPEINEIWSEKEPAEFKINDTQLKKAIQFALENEYSGSRDLRIAILKGF